MVTTCTILRLLYITVSGKSIVRKMLNSARNSMVLKYIMGDFQGGCNKSQPQWGYNGQLIVCASQEELLEDLSSIKAQRKAQSAWRFLKLFWYRSFIYVMNICIYANCLYAFSQIFASRASEAAHYSSLLVRLAPRGQQRNKINLTYWYLPYWAMARVLFD